MNNEEHILENLKVMSSEILHLRQLVHFQSSEIDALRIHAVARIADLSHIDRKQAFDEIQEVTKKTYDKLISKIEAIDPAIAASLDMRPSLEEPDQEDWYLAPYRTKPKK
jgi:hypothetical protein